MWYPPGVRVHATRTSAGFLPRRQQSARLHFAARRTTLSTVFPLQDSTPSLRRPSLVALTALALLLLTTVFHAGAHVPVPDSVLDPRSAPEAWNVLRLATANVERLLKENRLSEIDDQLSLCAPALRTLPRLATADRQRPVAEQAIVASVAVSSMAQAAAVGDRPTSESALASLHAALDKMSTSFDPATVHADIFYCPMHPDVVSATRAAVCPKCGMALVPRHIPYSFVYVPPGEPSLLLTATTDHPLAQGRPVQVTILLRKRDGSPVLLPDLTITHTQPIHMLIVDPALEDYHHEHPVQTSTPGEYTFSFTPAKASSYRIFADVVPSASGVQEYPYVDLPGSGSPPAIHQENTTVATVAGLRFQLLVENSEREPLRAQQPRNLRITIQDLAGQPVTRLEPVMAAFAHLVGFYADGHTVVHLHPAGGEITNPTLRGGSSLDFKFFPPKPGFLRLYVQVQLDGQAIFAPFGLHVEP